MCCFKKKRKEHREREKKQESEKKKKNDTLNKKKGDVEISLPRVFFSRARVWEDFYISFGLSCF